MRETTFNVITQGDVKMLHNAGYALVGDGDAVCFYIDPVGRAWIEGHTESANNCPVIFIARDGAEHHTVIEFTEFPGWRFHAGGDGKTIAVSLVRRAADNA